MGIPASENSKIFTSDVLLVHFKCLKIQTLNEKNSFKAKNSLPNMFLG